MNYSNKTIVVIAILCAIALSCAAAVLVFNNDNGDDKTKIWTDVSGTDDLPIITVKGDLHTDQLPYADLGSVFDYNEWIKKNITEGKSLPVFDYFACSVFSYSDANNAFVGRNLDFLPLDLNAMIVKYVPENGYKSINITPSFSVFDYGETIEEMSKDIRVRAAPLTVMDGINEKGLSCALLVVNNAKTSESKEGAMFSMPFMRYILDYTATVDEVIEIANKFGFSSDLSMYLMAFSLHIFIADANGDTLIIECVNGELCLTRGQNVITNHYITPKGDVDPPESSIERYNVLKKEVAKLDETATASDCMDILEIVKIEAEGGKTLWSSVYDCKNLCVTVCIDMDYDHPYVFKISDMK